MAIEAHLLKEKDYARNPPRPIANTQCFAGSGTAVTWAWLKVRSPVLVILSFDLQCGSGHAISASVDIQSFSWVGRCFAARRGSTAAKAADSENGISHDQ